jgi:hypothetical protein
MTLTESTHLADTTIATEVSGATQQPITDLEAEVQRTSRVAAYLAQVTDRCGRWVVG